MNNEINDKNYIPLTPFKGWVLENFPFIEANFDAITNYELLCLIVKYLNEVISNQNQVQDLGSELVTAYNELLEYVNNYFDNLDVQEEINNKLDAMAEDGSLTNLIKNYVDPFINQQNALISEINTKVNAATSGSPLVASSTDGMTNTNRVYVNTTDGKWYYYDGDSWEIGGTYQSTELSDNQVDFDNLSSNLQNSLDSVYSDTAYYTYIKNNYYLAYNIVETSANNFAYYKIPVIQGEQYHLDIFYDTVWYGTSNFDYAFIDNSNNPIYRHKVETATTGDKINSYDVTVPNGATYLCINTRTGQSITASAIVKINNYNQKNKISYSQLDDDLKGLVNQSYDEISDTIVTVVNNGFYDGSNFVALSGYAFYDLPVEPNKKYKIHTYQDAPFSLFFGSKDKKQIYTFNGNNIEINEYITKYKNDPTMVEYDYEFTAPIWCNHVYINTNKSHTTKAYVKDEITLNVDAIDMNSYNKNALDEKMILFTGDSVTEGYAGDPNPPYVPPYNNSGWVSRIDELNVNTTVYGYGNGGTTIAKRDGTTSSILERMTTMYSDHPNADYIIIQGGINDCLNAVPLGNIVNGYDATFDEYTFTGALESLFKYAQNNWLGKKIGFIVGFKIATSRPFKDYMDKAKEVCDKWSVPYLDLYNKSNLNYKLSSVKLAFSKTDIDPTGDGIHPNADGYDILTNEINSWLKTL